MYTQKQLLALLAEEFDMPVTRVYRLIKRYHEVLINDLVKEHRIEIPALGVFAVHVRPKHTTTHPKTGESVVIPKKKALRYRSCRPLRRRLNPKEAAKGSRKKG